MEAALAARAIAGHLAAMDSFAHAAKLGVSDEKVIRLRANAFAAGLIFDRQFQALRRQHQPAPDRTSAANGAAAAARARRRADPPLPIPGVSDAVMRRCAGLPCAPAQRSFPFSRRCPPRPDPSDSQVNGGSASFAQRPCVPCMESLLGALS
jgi:hypothetical protein